MIAFMQSNNLDTGRLAPAAKILVVDDDEAVLRYIATVLNETGWNLKVETTTNGYDALVRIGAKVPDLVILDVIMPGMDGKEVLRSLRQSKSTRGLKILAVSAYPEEVEKMREIGADAAMCKPFKAADFRETAAGLLPRVVSRQA